MPSMQSVQPSQAACISSIRWIFAGLLCVLPIAGILAPRLFGLVPAIMGLIFFLLFTVATKKPPKINGIYAVAAVLIAGLAALSSFWAIDADFALERSGKIALILIGGVLLTAILSDKRDVLPARFSLLFPVCLGIAGLVCIADLLSHGVIHHMWRGTETLSRNVSLINRAVVSFVFLLPLALQFLKQSALDWRMKTALAGGLFLITAGVMALTDSQSAQISILVMAVFWFVCPVRKCWIWPFLSVAVCMGVLGMPWIVQFGYESLAAGFKNAPWLSQAYAADRLEIWDFVARKALENPLYGFGIEATRHIEHFETALLYTDHDHVLHPHNAFLQIWIEFGLVGALGVCALSVTILRILSRLPEESARLCLSLFMGVLAAAGVSYGIWQSWWIGLFTLLVALCAYQRRTLLLQKTGESK